MRILTAIADDQADIKTLRGEVGVSFASVNPCGVPIVALRQFAAFLSGELPLLSSEDSTPVVSSISACNLLPVAKEFNTYVR